MQQNVSVVFVIEKQNSVVSRPQLPYIFFQMFGNWLTKSCSMVFQKLYVLGNLFVLNSGILVGYCFFL